jgi:cyclophilin family peptidyl-prolyl cis-trans isomerase
MELETRTTPAFLPGVFGGGVAVAAGDIDGDKFPDLVMGAGPGGTPHVRVINGQTGNDLLNLEAFDPRFGGGVSVAAGDVEGTGQDDIIVGAGAGGGPEVRVIRSDGNVIRDFMAFDPRFNGGVFVASADVDGDGKSDIIVGAGAGGGPEVKVFSGATGQVILDFMAFDPRFGGGVRVAGGDTDGDGKAEVVVGAGYGGGPMAAVFSNTGTLLHAYFPFDQRFGGGVNVAVGDVNGDGKADIIAGAGLGGGPEVRVLDAATGNEITAYMAYHPLFGGGVNVGSADINGDGKADIVTGAGLGGSSHVVATSGADLTMLASFNAFPPAGNPPGGFSHPADQVPPTLTLSGPASGQTVNKNLTVTGSASDNVGLASIQEQIDSAGFTDVVTNPANGAFSFTTTLATDGTADGPHTISVRARDKAGNVSPVQSFTLTLKTQVAQPVFNLDAASDTGPVGDGRTADATVTLTGQTDAGATVTLAGQTVTADSTGKFTVTNVALAAGPNSLTAQATDTLGNTSSFTRTITRDQPPTVSTALADVSVPVNAPAKTLNLSQNFTDPDVGNSVVQLQTSEGPINIQLFDQQTPLTVNNFLNYVTSGRYANTIFHRSVPGFVLQGGGFVFNTNPSRLTAVQTDPAVQNEPGISNTRGTVAMAKLGGDPNSATSQFFFNLADNSGNLDNQNGGFTVFGKVADDASQAVVDRLAAIPTQDRSTSSDPNASALSQIPLQNYPTPPAGNFPTDTTSANYAFVSGATVQTRSDQLTFTATSSNPTLVTAKVSGNNLTLTYGANQTGTATITVTATDQDGATATQTFKITVA